MAELNALFLNSSLNLRLGEEVRLFNTQSGMDASHHLIVVDRRVCLVGSAGWAKSSISDYRHVCLLVDCPEIARYFTGIFEADWQIGLTNVTEGK